MMSLALCATSNSRLPKHALSWLDAAMPSPEDSAESSAASYRSMERYLMENRHTIFPNATTDWCVVHNRRCSLFPESCQPDDDQLQPLVMNFAGTTCRGWSAAGKSRHFSDPSERPHAVWVTERRYRAEELQEALFFSECTPRYPVEVTVRVRAGAGCWVVRIDTLDGWWNQSLAVFQCCLWAAGWGQGLVDNKTKPWSDYQHWSLGCEFLFGRCL